MPLISVIVPCYNQAQYLDECLQSVLDQTFEDWECIIVNDGSPDNTAEVAQKWVEKDSRFKYLYKENGGVSSARNFGIENAEGDWILPLDGDDYISNDYLLLAVPHFMNENVKVIYCKAEFFGERNGEFKLKEFSLKNLATENVIFCSGFFRKKDWKNIGGYDEVLTITYEDWEFWINLLKSGGKVLKINEVCFFYRIKQSSRNSNISVKRFPQLYYMEKKHVDFFHMYLGSNIRNYNQLQSETMLNHRLGNKVINKIYYVFSKMNIFSN